MRTLRALGLVFVAAMTTNCITVNNTTTDAGTDTAPPPDTGADVITDTLDVALDAPADDVVDGGSDATAFAQADHTPYPQIPPRDGGIVTAMRLVGVITQGDPATSQFMGFTSAVPGSDWYTALSQAYGLGTAMTSLSRVGPAITSDIAESDLRTYLDTLIQGDSTLTPDGHTIYVVFLPPGINVIENSGATNTNCSIDLGYHHPYLTNGDAWAWIQRCSSPSGETPYEQAMTTAAHEIAESATDTNGGYYLGPSAAGMNSPWLDTIWVQAGTEVGDLCAGERGVYSMYPFQRVWSNAAAMAGGDPCIPALSVPYYNVTGDHEWYTIQAGGSIDITITGWSTGPRADWYILSTIRSATYMGFTQTLASNSMQNGVATINNGSTATITVTAPSTAYVGDWMVITIYSSDNLRTGTPPQFPVPADGTDRSHYWVLGVHVM